MLINKKSDIELISLHTQREKKKYFHRTDITSSNLIICIQNQKGVEKEEKKRSIPATLPISSYKMQHDTIPQEDNFKIHTHIIT